MGSNWVMSEIDLVELFCMNCEESHDCVETEDTCNAFNFAQKAAYEAQVKLIEYLRDNLPLNKVNLNVYCPTYLQMFDDMLNALESENERN